MPGQFTVTTTKVGNMYFPEMPDNAFIQVKHLAYTVAQNLGYPTMHMTSLAIQCPVVVLNWINAFTL